MSGTHDGTLGSIFRDDKEAHLTADPPSKRHKSKFMDSQKNFSTFFERTLEGKRACQKECDRRVIRIIFWQIAFMSKNPSHRVFNAVRVYLREAVGRIPRSNPSRVRIGTLS